MVLSKSFVVLKAAVTPRVLPEAITLVTTNSRLTTFGLAAGAVFGGLAAGVAAVWGSPGALLFTALLAVAGMVLCLRIPAWVEVTEGEVPAALRATRARRGARRWGRGVVALWGNGATRVLTGFLTLFVAFVVKGRPRPNPPSSWCSSGWSARPPGWGRSRATRSAPVSGATPSVVLCAVGSPRPPRPSRPSSPASARRRRPRWSRRPCSALAKVSLDAVVQRDLPERSRASAFGRSETVLQLAWVFGGALGVLLPHDTFRLGFTVVAGVLVLVGVQTALVGRGIAPSSP